MCANGGTGGAVGDGLDAAGPAGHRAVELVMHHQVDGRQALLRKKKSIKVAPSRA